MKLRHVKWVILWSFYGLVRVDSSRSLTVVTYNLWNIMFNWDIRRIRIAQMLKEVQADFVGLQEVRGERGHQRDQVQDLQEITRHLLPHSVFLPAQDVTFPKGVKEKRWPLEGVGLLSSFPIVNHTGIHLKHHGGPDTNKRQALHATVDLGNKQFVSVIVVHFSYDRTQQCANAADIMKYITARKLEHVIVMGDFNAYEDFPFPVQQFSGYTPFSRCPKLDEAAYQVKLIDVWPKGSTNKGYTFSNMPHPGLESRPDRILASQQFSISDTKLLGDGSVYKSRFHYHIIASRLGKFWDAMQSGQSGRSCLIDCGPHASCRCGLCVSGGDKNACSMPDCDECTGSTRMLLLLSILGMAILFTIVIYALLRLFNAMNQSGHSEIGTCLGAHCCLCNPNLYFGSDTHTHTHKYSRSKLKSCFRCSLLCNRIPPMTFVILSVIVFFSAAQLALFTCSDAIQDIFNAIPEEFYPSDHLMLVASLEFNG